MKEKILVPLSRTEAEQIVTLVRANQKDGWYSGVKSHWDTRNDRILSAIETTFEAESLTFTKRDRTELIKVLADEAPEPNEKLKTARKRHDRIVGSSPELTKALNQLLEGVDVNQ